MNTGCTYELYWNNGQTASNGIVWSRLTESNSLNYTTRQRLDTSKDYFFKIRAKCACGYGAFSEARIVTWKVVPAQMQPPRTVANGCAINITWSAPANNGSPINKYVIEVLVGGNRYVLLPNCGSTAFNGGNNRFSNNQTFSCTIPMPTLAGFGFTLPNGSKVIARGAACNQAGCAFASPGTPTQIAATMASRSLPVSGLRVVNQNGNSVTLTHNAVPGAATYELQQCVNGRCTRYGQVYNIRNLPITVRINP